MRKASKKTNLTLDLRQLGGEDAFSNCYLSCLELTQMWPLKLCVQWKSNGTGDIFCVVIHFSVLARLQLVPFDEEAVR